MNLRYSCNMDNAIFIDNDDDILIQISFMQNRKISVIAKGVYFTFAALQSSKPFGITIDELFKTCKNTKKELESAVSELLQLGFLKVV